MNFKSRLLRQFGREEQLNRSSTVRNRVVAALGRVDNLCKPALTGDATVPLSPLPRTTASNQSLEIETWFASLRAAIPIRSADWDNTDYQESRTTTLRPARFSLANARKQGGWNAEVDWLDPIPERYDEQWRASALQVDWKGRP